MNRLPNGAARSAKRIAVAIKEARQSHGDVGVTLRQGVVQSIDPGPPVTVGVDLGSSGVTLPALRCLDSYNPVIGDVVDVAVWGASMRVLGPIKTALSQDFFEVFDGQSPPVRRVRLGLQLDGRYGLRVWGANGLLNYDFTT